MIKYPLLGMYPRLFGSGVGGWWATTPSDTNLFGSSDTKESEISRLLQDFNTDCLRAAVNATNAPVSSVLLRPITR